MPVPWLPGRRFGPLLLRAGPGRRRELTGAAAGPAVVWQLELVPTAGWRSATLAAGWARSVPLWPLERLAVAARDADQTEETGPEAFPPSLRQRLLACLQPPPASGWRHAGSWSGRAS